MMKHFKILAVILMLSIVLVPKHAKAVCEVNAEVSAAQGNVITRQAQEITNIIANLQAQIGAILPVELVDLLQKMTGMSTSVRTGMGEMWGDWEEAEKGQTAQMHASILDQTRNTLSSQNAELFNEAALNDEMNEVAAVTTDDATEQSCTFDTVMPHVTEVNNITRMVSNTMSGSLSERIIRGEDSQLERNAQDYQRYEATFCNRFENGGRAPCDADGSRVDGDIEIARTLMGGDTLRVESEEDMEVIEAAIDNLMGRPRMDNINPINLESSGSAQKAYLEKRSMAARMNMVSGLFWDITGERMPSRTPSEEIREMRIAAGVPDTDASANPSKYEFWKAWIEQVNSPPWIFELKGGQEKLGESELHLKALRLMMMNNLNLKMEKMAKNAIFDHFFA